MVPFPILPTTSAAERRLYEGFLEQLDDSYVVYHSVDWVLADRHGPKQGEADFVISHPVDGILVMEAKGGSIAYDPARRRWTQSGHSGSHLLSEDPFHQARDEMHSLVEILEARPGWGEWRPSYGYAVAFPDGTYEVDAHPGAPASLAIDRDDLGSLSKRVAEVMREWRHSNRTFGSRGMEALAEALGLRVEIRTPLKLLFGEEDRRIVELTQDQAYVRAFVLHRKRAAVTGPAGSGKTILATEVARHLAESGKRTLLTCFNRLLAEHLSSYAEGLPSLKVAHFHGLCVELAHEAGLEISEPASPTDRSWFDEALPKLLEKAAQILGPQFDAIVVDEAQDFQERWWPALMSLHVDPQEGQVYLFSDEGQDLYGGGSLPIAPEDLLPPLPHNLRNTRAIHEFVSVFFDPRSSGPGIAKGPPGRSVEVLSYSDPDELARLVEIVLINLTEQEQVPLDDIVVLTPSGKEKSGLWARGSVGRFRFSDRPEAGKVLWSSVHAFKGLERQVVILAEVSDKHDEDVGKYLRSGGTRARNHLVVIAAAAVAASIRHKAQSSGS
jgi:Nuclease-related domain/AAA domain